MTNKTEVVVSACLAVGFLVLIIGAFLFTANSMHSVGVSALRMGRSLDEENMDFFQKLNDRIERRQRLRELLKGEDIWKWDGPKGRRADPHVEPEEQSANETAPKDSPPQNL